MSLGRNKLAHLTVAILLAVGLSVCWAFVSTTIPQIMWQSRTRPLQTREELAVRKDGVPLVIAHNYLSNQLQIRRVDGVELSSDAPWQQIAAAYVTPPRERKADWPQRVLSFSSINDATWWYVVHNGRAEGEAYVVGFDRNSKRQIGFVGRNGFRTDELPEPERIPFRGNVWPTSQLVWPNGYLNQGDPPYTYATSGINSSYLFLLSQGNLLRMDPMQRRFETSYQGGDLQSISVRNTIAAQGVITSTAANSLPPKRVILGAVRMDELALRTDESLLFADSEGNVNARFFLPRELRTKTLTAYLLPDQQCLIRRQEYNGPQELIWLQPDGQITARQELNLNYPVSNSFMNHPLYQAAVVPVPLAYGMQLAAVYASDPNAPRGPTTRESLPMLWLGMSVLLLISAILAFHGFRRQKQFHFGAAWRWSLFVFLIGIPGYLAYRFHRRWPTVDHCPRCAAVTTVRDGRCANCGDKFPMPERTGVEVFA